MGDRLRFSERPETKGGKSKNSSKYKHISFLFRFSHVLTNVDTAHAVCIRYIMYYSCY